MMQSMKNDCISRQAAIDLMMQKWGENFSGDDAMQESIDAIREMPSVTPQEPKTGYLSIDDVMSVFDDFMRGEADEDGTETFWEMLKDKAESEG